MKTTRYRRIERDIAAAIGRLERMGYAALRRRQGWPLAAIALRLGVSQTTVRNDLRRYDELVAATPGVVVARGDEYHWSPDGGQ